MFIDSWHSPFEIFTAWLQGGQLKLNWPQFRDKTVFFTHLARVSIALAYKLLGLLPGDEVLVPSYNCGSEIDPLIKCGARIAFYRVDSCARIDPEDIRSRVTPKTRAIYTIHYFGWPQNLIELGDWCREKNLLLIEDCALSLFSRGPEGPVGSIGDAAIYCFWKTIPVPDGGALALPKGRLATEVKLRPPEFNSVFKKMQPFLKRWIRKTGRKYFASFYNLLRKHLRRRRYEISAHSPAEQDSEQDLTFPDMPKDYYFDEKIINWTISRLSKGIINRSNPNEIVQIRRRNYEHLFEAIHNLPGIQPLFDDLPEGVCPLVMPVLVSNANQLKISLNKRNIFPIRWWNGYHRAFSWEGFPEACELKNNLLAFHIDQFRDDRHIEYVAESIKEVSFGKI